jgi:hypothetical protein
VKKNNKSSSSISPPHNKTQNITNNNGNTNNPETKSEDIEITPTKKTKVILQFLYTPEYLTKGNYIIINENNLKAFGRITHILYDTLNKFSCDALGTNTANKKRKSSVPPEFVS